MLFGAIISANRTCKSVVIKIGWQTAYECVCLGIYISAIITFVVMIICVACVVAGHVNVIFIIYVSAVGAFDFVIPFFGIIIVSRSVRLEERVTAANAVNPMSVIAVAVVFGRFPTFNGVCAIAAFYYVIFGSGGVHIEIVVCVSGIVAIYAFDLMTA